MDWSEKEACKDASRRIEMILGLYLQTLCEISRKDGSKSFSPACSSILIHQVHNFCPGVVYLSKSPVLTPLSLSDGTVINFIPISHHNKFSSLSQIVVLTSDTLSLARPREYFENNPHAPPSHSNFIVFLFCASFRPLCLCSSLASSFG